MPTRYKRHTLSATKKLIEAIKCGDVEKTHQAIQEGGDVNCRVIDTRDGYRIASDDELKTSINNRKTTNRFESIEVEYEVPMVDTTTLLNILARHSPGNTTSLALAEILMNHGAELGAIDYASYWIGWVKLAQNYFQNTPLLNAIATYNLDFAYCYLRFLGRLDEDKRKEILDYKDKFEAGFHTALEFAIRRGYSQLAKDIVDLGANPNPQPFIYSYAGKSPLHMACMNLGQSWVPARNKWHKTLGSDLDLILVLLEHGADFNLTVDTEIYIDHIKKQCKTIPLAPFDHIDISTVDLSDRSIDPYESCQLPAFSPKKKGQIKHPFNEDESFRSPMAHYENRKTYLTSQFKTTDKIIIQNAIIKRIISDFTSEFEISEELSAFIVCLIDSEDSLTETFGLLDMNILSEPQRSFLDRQLRYGGMYYDENKTLTFPPIIPNNDNPILNLARSNKIPHCPINEYERLVKYVTDLPEIDANEQEADVPVDQNATQDLDPSLLLSILAQPATKILATLFIVAGIAGLACGGSAALIGVSAGSIVIACGLGIAGFFARSNTTTSNVYASTSIVPDGPI
jgi:ankyrin repeat protein